METLSGPQSDLPTLIDDYDETDVGDLAFRLNELRYELQKEQHYGDSDTELEVNRVIEAVVEKSITRSLRQADESVSRQPLKNPETVVDMMLQIFSDPAEPDTNVTTSTEDTTGVDATQEGEEEVTSDAGTDADRDTNTEPAPNAESEETGRDASGESADDPSTSSTDLLGAPDVSPVTGASTGLQSRGDDTAVGPGTEDTADVKSPAGETSTDETSAKEVSNKGAMGSPLPGSLQISPATLMTVHRTPCRPERLPNRTPAPTASRRTTRRPSVTTRPQSPESSGASSRYSGGYGDRLLSVVRLRIRTRRATHQASIVAHSRLREFE